MVLHKKLSDTAIKLSVYSAILDFGLTLSVLLLNSSYLPGELSASLVSIFDDAITYLSLVIVGLFVLALALRLKEHVVNVYSKSTSMKPAARRIKVYMPAAPIANKQAQASVATAPRYSNFTPVQRVVNGRNESFIKFNGNWYKSGSERFERVSRPDYSRDQ